ncbi:MAG: flagellar basal body rod protein FlgC [Acidobacteriota bacterium]
MSLFSALDISATGLTAQRRRLEVISSNLANANTTRTPEGGPYRRRDVVFEAVASGGGFPEVLDAALGDRGARGVEVVGVYEDDTPFNRKHDPSHPDADAEGYVLLPNVSPVEEMVNMLSATRSFEANVQSINAIKDMARRSLEIGK